MLSNAVVVIVGL